MAGTSTEPSRGEASSSSAAAGYPNPFLWVPTSYMTMGLVYVTVGSMANIMFKNMGMSNEDAASWSSLLGLPYTLKPIWAPLLELYRTKKFFVVLMQFILAGVLAGVAFTMKMPGMSFVAPAIALLGIAAFAGATQDIGSDGVYVTTLASKDQARYTGVQSMCWNLGPILANGLLIRLSGSLQTSTGSWGTSWMAIMLIISGIVLAMSFFHLRVLPPGAKAQEAPSSFGDAMATFGKAFKTFFEKKDIVRLIAFAFFYRFGYGLLDKMGPLFMIDDRANGGLGLSNQQLGDINGIFGTAAFIAGSAIGGLFVAKQGLKRSLLILCLCLNVPNVTFLILSQTLSTNMAVITAIVTLEKLGWGIGCVGHMIYMMQQIAPGPYKTAHYTFATAFMGFCMMATGWLSGKIQGAVGYQTFFVIVLVAATPSLLATLLAPFNHTDDSAKAKA